MEFSPPRPLHMLPYYHGRKRFAEVASQLSKPGDYLVLTEPDGSGPSLHVQMENGKAHRQPIVKRQKDGKFVMEGERNHHAEGFMNIEELITYYDVYGLSIKDENELRLEQPVNATADDKLPSDRRRPFRQLKDLAHFHSAMKADEAEKLLVVDGDYLVREDPEKRGVFYLSVRGGGAFLHHQMVRDPVSGGYALPRGNPDMPIECVAMIDEWLQFHALRNVPVLGKFGLLRTIDKKPKP